jgi:hypothetical protein
MRLATLLSVCFLLSAVLVVFAPVSAMADTSFDIYPSANPAPSLSTVMNTPGSPWSYGYTTSITLDQYNNAIPQSFTPFTQSYGTNGLGSSNAYITEDATNQSLTLAPGSGYVIVRWTAPCSGTDAVFDGSFTVNNGGTTNAYVCYIAVLDPATNSFTDEQRLNSKNSSYPTSSIDLGSPIATGDIIYFMIGTGSSSTATAQLSGTITETGANLTASGSSLPGAVVNTSYGPEPIANYVTVNGGSGDYTYSITSGLPSDFTFNGTTISSNGPASSDASSAPYSLSVTVTDVSTGIQTTCTLTLAVESTSNYGTESFPLLSAKPSYFEQL